MTKSTKKTSPKRKITFLCPSTTAEEVRGLVKKFPSANFVVQDRVDGSDSILALDVVQPNDLHDVVIICSLSQLPSAEECRSLYSLRKSLADFSVVALEGQESSYLLDRAMAEPIVDQLQASKNTNIELSTIIKQLHFKAARIQHKKNRLTPGLVFDPKTTLKNIGQRWHATFLGAWSTIAIRSLKDVLWLDQVARLTFSLFSVLLLVAMILMSSAAGISGDEFRYIRQSDKVIKYFESGGEDGSALQKTGIDPQHYNAQTFDVVVRKLTHWLGVDDQFRLRHNLNALVGWIGILFIGLLVARAYGWWWGLLAMFLMFFSPRYLGHCFNNHRDIPVATAYTVGVYFFVRYFQEFRQVRWTTLLGIFLAIAFAFSTRLASGVLMIGILGVITAVHLLKDLRNQWILQPVGPRIWRHIVYLLPTALIAYGMGILLWPFGLEGPIKNSLEVLNASSNLGVSLRQTFEGNLIMSNEIPRHYIPKYIAITTPILILASLLATTYASITRRIKQSFLLFILLFAFAFPLVYAIMMVKNDYGGWRHFLFVYPSLVGVGVIGLYHLYQLLPSKFRVAFVPFLILAMFHPIKHTVANHPYQYIYYNEVVGGVNNAIGKYETDYSLNSLQEGVRWVLEHAEPRADGEKIMLASNDGSQLVWGIRNDTARFAAKYKRFYEKFDADWDYGIFVNMYVHPEQIAAGHWPPPHTIHEIKVDDVTICAILKRGNKEELAGFEAAKAANHEEAVRQFRKYLESTPNNEQVWAALASSLRTLGRSQEAMLAADSCLVYHPSNLLALNVKGLLLLSQSQYAEAEPVFRKLQSQQARHYSFSYYLALSLANQQKYAEAKEFIDLSLRLNQKFAASYDLAAAIYRGLGLTDQAEQWVQLKAKL